MLAGCLTKQVNKVTSNKKMSYYDSVTLHVFDEDFKVVFSGIFMYFSKSVHRASVLAVSFS